MRISTPEGIWPQHFFRNELETLLLNKMHDRINKRDASASSAAGKSQCPHLPPKNH